MGPEDFTDADLDAVSASETPLEATAFDNELNR
jgi:hypothetical protein